MPQEKERNKNIYLPRWVKRPCFVCFCSFVDLARISGPEGVTSETFERVVPKPAARQRLGSAVVVNIYDAVFGYIDLQCVLLHNASMV